MDDVKLAMLGNKEAAKRLTDAGVRIPCRCGAKGEIITMAKYGENRWKPAVIRCPKCHYEACLTDWNTRDYSSSDTCYEPSFCPICGKPITDEAVEMVMRRLEALKDGKGD